MSFDLTNKNISDTFQNLLQKTGSDNRLYDLEGNEVTNLRINGTLTADQYVVSSSVINVTTLAQSGSTAFGNSSDDSHTFQGNITASGNISASGDIFGNTFHSPSSFAKIHSDGVIEARTAFKFGTNSTHGVIDNTSTAGNITIRPGTSSGKLILQSANQTALTINNIHITASGNISSSGDSYISQSVVNSTNIAPGMALTVQGNISASGDLYVRGGEIYLRGTTTPNIYAASNLNATATRRISFGDGGPFIFGTQGRLNITNTDTSIADGGNSNQITFANDDVANNVAELNIVATEAHQEDVKGGVKYQFKAHSNATDCTDDGAMINIMELNPTNGISLNLPVTASGDISSSGTIIGGGLNINGTTTFNDGDITNVGDIYANSIIGDSDNNATFTIGTNGYVFNVGENDKDFKYFDAEENTLIHGDAGLSRVGIGDTTPVSKLDVAGDLNVQSHITASGEISASGTITSPNILSITTTTGSLLASVDSISITTGSLLTSIDTISATTSSLLNSIDEISTTTGSLLTSIDEISTTTGSLLNSIDEISATTSSLLNSVATISVITGSYAVTGSDVIFNHITASGNISSSGTIFASKFESAGASGETISFNDNLNITGDITASGNISSSGTITGNSLVGTLGTAAQGNVTSLGTLTTLTVDDITINGSQITDAGAFKIDAGGTIIINESSEAVNSFMLQAADTTYFRLDGDGQKIGIGEIAEGTSLPEVLTVEGNISSSGFISTLSHITASGNISASGLIHTFGGVITSDNISSITTTTGSLLASIDSISTTTGSLLTSINTISATTSSLLNSIDEISTTTGSLLNSITSISIVTGSYAVTGSDVTFGDVIAGGDLVVTGPGSGNYISASSGNLELSGSGTALLEVVGNISSSGTIFGNTFGGKLPTHISGSITAVSTSLSSRTTTLENSIDEISTTTGSLLTSINTISATTSSLLTSINTISATTSSLLNSIDEISTTTGSLFNSVAFLSILTGSYAVTSSNVIFNQITASGDISASGDIYGNDLYVGKMTNGLGKGGPNQILIGSAQGGPSGSIKFQSANASQTIRHAKDLNGGALTFTNNDGADVVLIGSSATDGKELTVQGDISASGIIIGTPNLIYNTSSISSTGNVQGDIVKFGNTTTIAGAIYAHTGSGWTLAGSGSNLHGSSSLGFAVGTNSSGDGILLRGMANLGYSPGGLNGCALYLESPGSASNIVPFTDGDVARVVGWNYGTDTIYFNPDNTWVEVSA